MFFLLAAMSFHTLMYIRLYWGANLSQDEADEAESLTLTQSQLVGKIKSFLLDVKKQNPSSLALFVVSSPSHQHHRWLPVATGLLENHCLLVAVAAMATCCDSNPRQHQTNNCRWTASFPFIEQTCCRRRQQRARRGVQGIARCKNSN